MTICFFNYNLLIKTWLGSNNRLFRGKKKGSKWMGISVSSLHKVLFYALISISKEMY